MRAEGGSHGDSEEWSDFGTLSEGRASRLPRGLGWGVRKERHHGSLYVLGGHQLRWRRVWVEQVWGEDNSIWHVKSSLNRSSITY